MIDFGLDKRLHLLLDLLFLLNMATNIEDDSTSYKVLKLLLQSSSDLFFSYLTNRELGVIDQIITDINMRQIFFIQTEYFYLSNKIQSLGESNWILKRKINITKCHLDFALRVKNTTNHHQ